MKKLFSAVILALTACLMLSFPLSGIYATNTVVVSAIVGNINSAPLIISVTPSSDPKLLGAGEVQNFSVYYRDNEKDSATFTVTPQDGFVTPISGRIPKSSYDTNSGATINFTYRAPESSVGTSQVTVTINDGSNVTTKTIGLYIY